MSTVASIVMREFWALAPLEFIVVVEISLVHDRVGFFRGYPWDEKLLKDHTPTKHELLIVCACE